MKVDPNSRFSLIKFLWCHLAHRKHWMFMGVRKLKASVATDYQCKKCGFEQSDYVMAPHPEK
jgi:hypothetical protein